MDAISMIAACGRHQAEGPATCWHVLLPVVSGEPAPVCSDYVLPQEPMGNGAEPPPEGIVQGVYTDWPAEGQR